MIRCDLRVSECLSSLLYEQNQIEGLLDVPEPGELQNKKIIESNSRPFLLLLLEINLKLSRFAVFEMSFVGACENREKSGGLLLECQEVKKKKRGERKSGATQFEQLDLIIFHIKQRKKLRFIHNHHLDSNKKIQ